MFNYNIIKKETLSVGFLACLMLNILFISSCADDEPATEEVIPVASFTFTAEGLTVTFTNTSTDAVSSSWDFGADNATSTETSPSFTYPEGGGTFTVTLTVTSSTGDTDEETMSVTVAEAGSDDIVPAAAFTSSVEEMVATFTNTTTFSGAATEDENATFAWDFGVEGDDTDVSTDESPVFAYDEPGEFMVTLTVTSSTGNTNTAMGTVMIEDPSANDIIPTAAFESSVEGMVATFTNTTMFSGAAMEDEGATFAWDFGVEGVDTDISDEESPMFTYPEEGEFMVTLTVTSSTGNMSTANGSVMISGGSTTTQAAIIRDLRGGEDRDTGELRFDIEASLTGRLEVTFTRTEMAVDMVTGNGRDAFIALLNSTGSTSSERSIMDLRINDDSFELRDQGDAEFSATPTPGTLQTAVFTWTAADAETVPTVTFMLDGEEVTAPFASGANALGGVERIQFRFGDNDSIIPEDQFFTIERFAVYSDTEGTNLLFSTDFSEFSVGEVLDGEGDPFSGNSSDATVEEL